VRVLQLDASERFAEATGREIESAEGRAVRGHETYPVYKNEYALQDVENGVRWLGVEAHAGE
jgi:trehalose utilization protein